MSRIKTFLSTFGIAPVSNAIENIVVGQNSKPSSGTSG
jgi:hypothetical protein